MGHAVSSCALALILLLSMGSAVAADEPPSLLSQGDGPQFRCQLGQRLSTEADSLRLIVAVSVPYDNLVFLRADSGFVAEFELVTSVFRDGKGLYGERITSGQALARSYAETNSRIRNASRVDEYRVPPGDYRVRVSLAADKASRKKSRWEGTISLAPSDALLRVSDLYWVSEDLGLSELGTPRLVESFYTNEDSATAHVQLFSAAQLPVALHWTVLGEASDTVRTKVDTLLPTGGIQDAEYVLAITGLPAQRYVLRLEAEGNGRREVRTRSFGVRIPGIPTSITDLDVAIRQLRFIATPQEMSELRNARPADRERLFKEFWKKRDPTSNSEENELMDEYYRRVQYANEKFSTTREGWESDRGRVYINYGEPTDVERHPFEAGSRPYEIWYYSHLALRFMFVDYTGYGDYQLVTPEWGY